MNCCEIGTIPYYFQSDAECIINCKILKVLFAPYNYFMGYCKSVNIVNSVLKLYSSLFISLCKPNSTSCVNWAHDIMNFCCTFFLHNEETAPLRASLEQFGNGLRKSFDTMSFKVHLKGILIFLRRLSPCETSLYDAVYSTSG